MAYCFYISTGKSGEIRLMRRILGALLLVSIVAFTVGCDFGGPVPGKVAPNFSAKDMDGDLITLSDYRGKVVLLDFWATWCAPCVAEIPSVKAAYDKYKDQGFVVIGVNLDQDMGKLKQFVSDQGIAWPQVIDGASGGKVSDLYKVQYIPSTFLIDKQGVIQTTGLRGHDIKVAAKALLDSSI